MRMTLLALCGLFLSSCVFVADDWGEPPRFTSFESGEASQGEAGFDARIELPVGKLEVQPGSPEDVYRLELYYDENSFSPKADFRRDGDQARLRFELSGEGRGFPRKLEKTRLNLRLNPETPLSLDARTGVGESEIDLTGMKVSELRLSTGVGETSLAMLSSNRTECRLLEIKNGVGELEVKGLGNFGFRRLKFQGGVGSAKLDFSGAWENVGEIGIEVGVGGVEVLIPRSMGAEIRSSQSFLSSLDLSDFTKRGDVYISNNHDRVEKSIRLSIDAGIGGVEIRWI